MFLFAILLLILVFITIFTVAVVSVGGAVFIVIFGDVIVCAFIIVWLLRKLLKK